MPVTNLELTTSGPDDTRTLAAALSPLLEAGDVVALSGGLGAGKTCFAQGALRGLEVRARVTSPTFVLMRQYSGRLPVVHCDVYRLDRLRDVADLGEDVFAADVVTFVEWADAVTPLLPDDRLEVVLGTRPLHDDLEEVRTVTLRALGQRWADRREALAATCTPWKVRDTVRDGSREAAAHVAHEVAREEC